MLVFIYGFVKCRLFCSSKPIAPLYIGSGVVDRFPEKRGVASYCDCAICWFGGVGYFFVGSLILNVVRYLAFKRVYESFADCQAEALTFGFGRDEWLEDFGFYFF